jgi:hypothetical protein
MIFPYLPLPTKRPIASLDGTMVRYRPIVPIRIFGPKGSRLVDGCLDSGSDDTIFPISLAKTLGLDLSGSQVGAAHPVGGASVTYQFIAVSMTLSNGTESFHWQAVVGFVDLPLRWALLGHAGFLLLFDVHLLGEQRSTVIATNALFTGTNSKA